MTVCVFAGPTVSWSEIEGTVAAVCLPPVAQGDVLRAVRRFGPHAIGIVDGLFGGAPAVWHKEILWALSEGIAVFGSASMGALRAAELHVFGMRGVGRIFEAYRDGRLEDDDEVALMHGPAELDYPALSEPMVNIRATLARAEREGVLGADARGRLEAHAKSLHFPERDWPDLIDHARRALDPAAAARVAAWLPTGRIDQKRADALEMMAALRDVAAVPPAPFRFAETHHWRQLVDQTVVAEADDVGEGAQRVLDELRLGPQELARDVQARALLRYATLGTAEHAGRDAETAEDPADGLRARLGLYGRGAFVAWLAANDLDVEAFRRLADRSRRAEGVSRRAATRLAACLVDELRLSGHYTRLAARARAKAAALDQAGHVWEGAIAPGDRVVLRQWFAARRLEGAADAGVSALVAATGFADPEVLDRALRREHLYLTLATPTPED